MAAAPFFFCSSARVDESSEMWDGAATTAVTVMARLDGARRVVPRCSGGGQGVAASAHRSDESMNNDSAAADGGAPRGQHWHRRGALCRAVVLTAPMPFRPPRPLRCGCHPRRHAPFCPTEGKGGSTAAASQQRQPPQPSWRATPPSSRRGHWATGRGLPHPQPLLLPRLSLAVRGSANGKAPIGLSPTAPRRVASGAPCLPLPSLLPHSPFEPPHRPVGGEKRWRRKRCGTGRRPRVRRAEFHPSFIVVAVVFLVNYTSIYCILRPWPLAWRRCRAPTAAAPACTRNLGEEGGWWERRIGEERLHSPYLGNNSR